MGNCVASVMSVSNSCREKPLHDALKVRTMGQQSVEIGEAQPKEGRIRRSPSSKDLDLFDKFGGSYPSLMSWIKSSCEKYADRNAIAYRPIAKEEKAKILDDKGKEKEWLYIHMDATKYLTYREFWDQISRVGAGLDSLGIQGQGARVGLYEDTRYEWIVTLYGLWSQNIVGVTVYANLGDDALTYAVEESELVAVFCSGKNVKNLTKMMSKKALPSLKFIIVYDAIPDAGSLKMPEGIRVLTFSELLNAAKPKEMILPSKTDTAVIMYTSGTTGDPKGVVMSHSNLVAAVETLNRRLVPILGPVPIPGEAYLAYLPLAHILEMSAENVMFARGSTVAYGTPRTLTDTSARPHGDLREFRPTVFTGVPRIYDTIKKAIEGKLPPPGSLKRTVFDRAYEDRRQALLQGRDTPYWNEKAFGMPRGMLGGNVRAFISGGAPLNGATHEFLTIVFGASVGQGYGLTETCALATLQRYWDIQKENVGAVVSCVEMKLRDAGDNWIGAEGRGEVLIRGPNVTQGYFKQPEKTAEVFGKDGWFATGDVGEWQKDGTLKIIGRVKALAKNAHGEYIAMEALEATYTNNELAVPNGICVVVDSNAPYICALMLTDEAKAMAFAKKHNLAGSYPDILATAAFRTKAVESLGVTGKVAGKKPFEFIKSVRIYNHEWTPENGILTAAMKLKRREIDKKYADDIREMFSAPA